MGARCVTVFTHIIDRDCRNIAAHPNKGKTFPLPTRLWYIKLSLMWETFLPGGKTTCDTPPLHYTPGFSAHSHAGIYTGGAHPI